MLIASMARHYLYSALSHDSMMGMKLAVTVSEFKPNEQLFFLACLGHLCNGMSEQFESKLPAYPKMKKKICNDLKTSKSIFMENFL